jgi:hypothetical protein
MQSAGIAHDFGPLGRGTLGPAVHLGALDVDDAQASSGILAKLAAWNVLDPEAKVCGLMSELAVLLVGDQCHWVHLVLR